MALRIAVKIWAKKILDHLRCEERSRFRPRRAISGRGPSCLAPAIPQRVLTIGAEFAQIAGRNEPFRAEIRDHLKGRTQALEDLAVELLARGLSVRDIEDAFKPNLNSESLV